jgi:hypothetical protein
MESTLQEPAFVAAKTIPKATTRSVFRWIHLVLDHVVRRLLSKRSA